MNYNFDPNEALNKKPELRNKQLEPKIDPQASKICGKKILALDPRLINLVVKFKKKKKDPDAWDNFYQNPEFIKQLKELFNSSK